jgi:hypothetical protein
MNASVIAPIAWRLIRPLLKKAAKALRDKWARELMEDGMPGVGNRESGVGKQEKNDHEDQDHDADAGSPAAFAGG